MTMHQAIPAYGRDYKTMKAVREAWRDGFDFRLYSGSYVSSSELPKGDTILIRFDGNRKVVSIRN